MKLPGLLSWVLGCFGLGSVTGWAGLAVTRLIFGVGAAAGRGPDVMEGGKLGLCWVYGCGGRGKIVQVEIRSKFLAKLGAMPKSFVSDENR